MRIFAIGDLHLSFSADKPMHVFGSVWENHAERLAEAWKQSVGAEDLVLIPGDISWAMRLSDAAADLAFIDALPGTKVLLRGNHDYWWNTVTQVRGRLPPSMHAIQNDSLVFGRYAVGGTRLWTLPNAQYTPQDEKIYTRELIRLELSLQSMPAEAEKIVMLHFPPFDERHGDTQATALLERYGVRCAVYAHLHGKAHRAAYTGEKNGVEYVFTAADYLLFQPKRIV